MSAFVVSKSHIDALIQVALGTPGRWVTWRGTSGYVFNANRTHCQLDHTCLESVGSMLFAENYRSVEYRYPNETRETLGSDCLPEEYGGLPGPAYRRPTLSPVAALKALSCYEYQSCECPDWEETEAYRFCQALRAYLIPLLPGWEEAEWSVD